MSDKLRAEIEQWAKDWSDENSFDPGMEGLGELHAILDQDEIRAAAPDSGMTEWGVQYMSDLVVQVRDEESAHLRKAVSIVPDTAIVCRRAATPWQVTL